MKSDTPKVLHAILGKTVLDHVLDSVSKAGIKDIVLDTGSRTLRKAFEEQVWVRSAALLKKFRPFGFPTIVLPCEMTDDPMKEAIIASAFGLQLTNHPIYS